jgi:tetratricopeptide (TPR) repeat protein
MGQHDRALADFTTVVRLKPDLEAAWRHCGFLRQTKGDNTGAVADYSKAIELDPKDEAAWRGRGLSNFMRSRLDDAIADLTQAIALDGNDALAFHMRSQAYGGKHDGRHAAQDDDAALRLDPRLAQVGR